MDGSNRNIEFLFCLLSLHWASAFSEDYWDIQSMNIEANIKKFSEPIRFPGTKWCGPGSDATDYNELGSNTKVDSCCRAHDNCDYIETGNEKYGLVNTSKYTTLHCRCDREFRDCLKKIGSKYAGMVGRLYFAWQSKCYKEEYPLVRCSKKSWGVIGRRCSSYEMDLNGSKKFQWFDLPYYHDSGIYDAFRDV